MNIPRAFWAIIARAYLLALIDILGSLLLGRYAPTVAIFGEAVGGVVIVEYTTRQLLKLR